MSAIIKYQNTKREFVTKQQALQLDDYSKLFFVNNEIKKNEVYKEKELWGGVYYLSESENVVEVLNDLGINLKWSFCTSKEIINDYTIYEYRGYNEDLEEDPKYTKSIEDLTGRIEVYISYDTATNNPLSGLKIYKIGGLQLPDDLEGVLWEDDASIVFRINENGVYNIKMNYNIIEDKSQWESIESFKLNEWFIEAMFPGDMLAYFASLDLVPNF